jgi:hypothetical protein
MRRGKKQRAGVAKGDDADFQTACRFGRGSINGVRLTRRRNSFPSCLSCLKVMNVTRLGDDRWVIWWKNARSLADFQRRAARISSILKGQLESLNSP